MTDFMSARQRSHAMSQVRGKDTKIERLVRSHLHRKGFRFRKNAPNLPGRPDIVLSKYNAVIFVHGCFWHGHLGCERSRLPTTRAEFWQNKIGRTLERDKEKIEALSTFGCRIAVVWQCAITNKTLFSNAMEVLIKWIVSHEDSLELPKPTNI